MTPTANYLIEGETEFDSPSIDISEFISGRISVCVIFIAAFNAPLATRLSQGRSAHGVVVRAMAISCDRENLQFFPSFAFSIVNPIGAQLKNRWRIAAVIIVKVLALLAFR